MRRQMLLLLLVAVAVFTAGCADILMETTMDGEGNVASFAIAALTDERTLAGIISEEMYDMYAEDFAGEERAYIYFESFRSEAPFGAKITIDVAEAGRMERTEEALAVVGFIVDHGMDAGGEYVSYYIPPDDTYEEAEFEDLIFVTFTTTSPGSERDHTRVFSFPDISRYGVDFTARLR